MQPYNYSLRVQSPTDVIMGGLYQGFKLAEIGQKKQAEQAAYAYKSDPLYASLLQGKLETEDGAPIKETLLQKYPQFSENTINVFNEGQKIAEQKKQYTDFTEELKRVQGLENPSSDDFVNLSLMAPKETKDAISKYWESKNEEKMKNYLATEQKVLSATLQDPNKAIELLEEQAQAASNSGKEEEAKMYQGKADLIKANPKNGYKLIASGLSLMPGGADIVKTTMDIYKPKEQYSVLSDQDKEKLGLPLEGNYQISPDGKISEIGSKGVSVNIEGRPQVGTIPQGYQLTKKGDSWVMEPIPGSPQEQEVKNVATKKAKSNAEALTTGGIVFEDIERLKKIIKENSLVAGSLETVIPDFLIQDRINANMLKETIVANIGFDKLQRMREASPTGGALGSVSDRELSNLQAVLGNLSLSQSEEQLLANLDRLGKLYTNILKKAQAYPNASEFGFGQKAKTVEEANSLGITFE